MQQFPADMKAVLEQAKVLQDDGKQPPSANGDVTQP